MMYAFRYVNSLEYLNIYTAELLKIVRPLMLSRNRSEYLFFASAMLLSLFWFGSGRWFFAVLMLFLGMIWVFLESGFFLYLRELGVDSLLETNDFDGQEASFWFSSFLDSVRHFFNPIFLGGLYHKLCLYIIISIASFLLLEKIRKLADVSMRSVSIILPVCCAFGICFSVFLRFQDTAALWRKNSDMITQLWSNFSMPLPKMTNDQRKLTLVTYIGESTTVMNMGIYNAPEDNMPELGESSRSDPGFILFNNVFSTHSHTSQSLLEALSVAALPGEDFLPIHSRHRHSMIDLLRAGNVRTILLNNQGLTGSFNQTATVVFRNVDGRINSMNSRLVGNMTRVMKRPFDHVFFNQHLPAYLGDSGAVRQMIVLHSYAGHGPYDTYIPDSFRSKGNYSKIWGDPKAIVGEMPPSMKRFEAYRQTLKYIDFSVSRIIARVKAKPEPAIFIYFADHGESIFTGKGHESGHFIHEMLRVPFVLYFNPAAQRQYPELYGKYRSLASRRNPATLAQLPATIMELFGITGPQNLKPLPGLTPVMGEETRLPPVLVREKSDSITYVDLNGVPLQPHFPEKGLVAANETDVPSGIFTLNRYRNDPAVKFCYHRSNTYAKALRGSLVCDCLESDLVVQPDGTLALTHPPKTDVGFRLKDVFDIASRNRLAVWIDGKNLDRPANASKLLNFLRDSIGKPEGNLVEFPSYTHRNKDSLKGITDGIKTLGLATSYYVPTELGKKCRVSMNAGRPFKSDSSCIALEKDLGKALQSGLFTDFSFEFGNLRLMEMMPFTRALRWNTWGMPLDSARNLQPNRFRMVILKNDDPNTL
jgi:glucan phosphoethanolaminetransferase (alkaline phosphatase superfamily)